MREFSAEVELKGHARTFGSGSARPMAPICEAAWAAAATESADMARMANGLRELEKSAFRITEVMYKDLA